MYKTVFSLRRIWPAIVVFIVSFFVYIKTLCPTVFVEGTGENIVCAWTLGVPHPPGFPLFCILAKLFSILVPVQSIAYRVNLFSAIIGAVAVTILYQIFLLTGMNRLLATCAGLTFGFSMTFWRQATIAEVYTLSIMLMMIQIGLLIRWREEFIRYYQKLSYKQNKHKAENKKKRKKTHKYKISFRQHDKLILWLGFTFGLGLTVHYMHVLLIPAYIYFICSYDRKFFMRLPLLISGLTVILLGFSIHIYTPVSSLNNPPMDWGNPENLRNWWHYFTAAQYQGRMFNLPFVDVVNNLSRFFLNAITELRLLGAIFAALGSVYLFRRDRSLFWMTVLIFCVFMIWAVNYDVPWEIEVYYLTPVMVMAIWIGFGLKWLFKRLNSVIILNKLGLIVVLIPIFTLFSNFQKNDLSKQTFILDYSRDILDDIEENSVIILPSTNPCFTLMYLAQTNPKASSLDMLSRIAEGVTPVEHAVNPVWDRQAIPEPRYISQSLSKGKAVYTVDRQSEKFLAGIAQIPWGCVYRLVPVEEKEKWMELAPDPSSQSRRFKVEDQHFNYGLEHNLIACYCLLVQADYAWEKGNHIGADKLYEEVQVLGKDLPAISGKIGLRYVYQGRKDLAISIYQNALDEQEDEVLRNRLGALYGRKNLLKKAKYEFERAIQLKPDFAEAHANLASVYGRQGLINEAIKELKLALRYEPNNLLALKNLSMAYAGKKRYAEARKLLQKAIEVNPADYEIRAFLQKLKK
jgi:tetratricopeptide (TPR) repeat protein